MPSTAGKIRDSGLDAIGSLHWGTHFCHFYETPRDLLDILVPFYRAGIENAELCIRTVFDPLTEESTGRLRIR